MTKPLPHVGPLLAAAREKRGLTLEEVAAAVGSTAATISRIENKISRGGPKTLERLAAFYEIDPVVLVQGDLASLEHDHTEPVPAPADGVTARRPSWLYRSYRVMDFFDAPNIIRGPIGGMGSNVDPDTAKLAKAIRFNHHARGTGPEVRSVEVSQLPPDTVMVSLRSPLEVKVDGEIKLHLPAGVLLVVKPDEIPGGDAELLEQLVVVERPSVAGDPERIEGLLELRRFELHRGNRLLYPLHTEQGAVTESQGWRIVGAVVGLRREEKI